MDTAQRPSAGDVLLLTKTDEWSAHAAHAAGIFFGPALQWHSGSSTDPFPVADDGREYGAVISFLSPWIIPGWLLRRGALSLNFHPGSCDYPGIGCYNFAIYEGATRFGPVCHHMAEKVDSGVVISEVLFPLVPDERVETLKLRTMIAMIAQFQQISALIAAGEALPVADRQWTRRPFTRRELNALGRVTPDMAAEEVQRRVRAMEYPGMPGAELEVGGVRFVAVVPQRAPLA